MKAKIDVHTHFLPSIDDGAKSVEESVKMLCESRSQGVELCVATPHVTIHRPEDIDRFLEKRKHSFEKLKPHIEEGDFPRILFGAEIFLDNDLNRYDAIEKLAVAEGGYILTEFPVNRSNPVWAEWIYNLNRKGLKVMIAHVDRYAEWEKMMEDFRGLDVIYQVNASRFTDFWSGSLLKKLMRYQHKYVISSDMHNLAGRACNMAPAYEKAKKKMPNVADELFYLNAKSVLGL